MTIVFLKQAHFMDPNGHDVNSYFQGQIETLDEGTEKLLVDNKIAKYYEQSMEEEDA